MTYQTICATVCGLLLSTGALAQTIDQQDAAVATNLGLYGVEPMDIETNPNSSNYVFVSSYTPMVFLHPKMKILPGKGYQRMWIMEPGRMSQWMP